MNYQDIAAICHEANRMLCVAQDDVSQQPWDLAEQWQRDSAIAGVNFAANNPNAPASSQHDAWLADKRKDGWRYGTVKNPELKQHPCMVPYEQLPPMQQAKDHLFKAICSALLPFSEEAHNRDFIIG